MNNNDLDIQIINQYILKEKKKLSQVVGEKLKEKRKEKKISIIKLSEYINTSPTYISQIEKGEYSISLLKFIMFCNALEINSLDFLQEFICIEDKNEDILFAKLQDKKNISINILEFMKEKK